MQRKSSRMRIVVGNFRRYPPGTVCRNQDFIRTETISRLRVHERDKNRTSTHDFEREAFEVFGLRNGRQDRMVLRLTERGCPAKQALRVVRGR